MLGGLRFGLGSRTIYLDTEQKLRDEWSAIAAAMTLHRDEVGIQRSAEFMYWRFLTRPDRRYRIAVSHDRKRNLAGFFITRNFKPGVSLLVDHGIATTGPGVVSIDRPCIVMAPANRVSDIGAETRAVRIPARKEMPFFASCFDGQVADFSRVTLAASDF
jgi:hypothetical protein